MKPRAPHATAGQATSAAQHLEGEGRKLRKKGKKGELGDPQFAAALLEQATGALAVVALHAPVGRVAAPESGRAPGTAAATSVAPTVHGHGKATGRRAGAAGTDAGSDAAAHPTPAHAAGATPVRAAGAERPEEGRREVAPAASGASASSDAPRALPELPGPAAAARLLPPDAPPEAAVQGAVLARAAHLTVTTPAAGEVALHLRVRDGIADVRIEGHAAPALARAEASLSAELGTRGLQLRLDAAAPVQATSHAESLAAGAHGDRNGQPPPEDPRELAQGRPGGRSGTSALSPSSDGRALRLHDDGRIHVEA